MSNAAWFGSRGSGGARADARGPRDVSTATVAPGSRIGELLPGLTAALSFSGVDIMIKLVYASGMDTMTLVSLRGVAVVLFMAAWLRIQKPPLWHSRRQRNIALAIGVLFAGTMFGLLKAISLLPVSIAILAYFAYPVLTGVVGALTGIDRLGWRAFAAALAAFLGLALMLGSEFQRLSTEGIVWALGAAGFRVASLLMTRAYLNGTDPRVTTWYSMVPSAALFLLGSAFQGTWHNPETAIGWAAFAGVAAGSTLSTLLIYASTNRIGPFRTAFIMNLEPLTTTLASLLLLGEVLTPLQAVGAVAMLVSLCAFQFARAR
jgi:probable blue pigment (indigoidine) exporter